MAFPAMPLNVGHFLPSTLPPCQPVLIGYSFFDAETSPLQSTSIPQTEESNAELIYQESPFRNPIFGHLIFAR